MNSPTRPNDQFRISSLITSPGAKEKYTEAELSVALMYHQTGMWTSIDPENCDPIAGQYDSLLHERNFFNLKSLHSTSHVLSVYFRPPEDPERLVVFTALRREETVMCLLGEMTLEFMSKFTPEFLGPLGFIEL